MKHYLICGSADPTKKGGLIGTFEAGSSDAAIRKFVILNPSVQLPTIVWSELTKEEYDNVNRIMNEDVGRPIISNIFPTKDETNT